MYARAFFTLAVVLGGCAKLSDPPTTQQVRERLEKPTKACAAAAGVKPSGVSESWELTVVVGGSGEVTRVFAKGDAPPKLVSCASEAMKGQKFPPFGRGGSGEVERTVTISMFDTAQTPTTPPGFQPPDPG